MTEMDLTRFSVLIVDDNPNNLFTLNALLSERMGVQVVEAGSGMEALSTLLNQSVDVIILDVQMPELDGFETAAMIKQRKRDAEIPIIFLTAAAKEEEDVKAGFDLGAVDYLFKPVDEVQLVNKLTGYFRAIDQERQKRRVLEVSLEDKEEALADVEALNENILAAMPQGLVVVQDDRIIKVNDGFRRLFRGLIQTERGRPVSEIMERMHIPEDLQSKIRTKVAFSSQEITVPQAGAGDLDLVVQIDSIPFDDKLLVVINNVTEQKLVERRLAHSMEQAQAANRAKSQFLANMSHEFRTPLNGILGLTELIGTGQLDETQQQHLGLLANSANRLTKLVDDVLDMSRVEAGVLSLTVQHFDLRALAQEIIDIHGHAARTKGLWIGLEPTDLGPIWLRGDENRIRQVLVNLVGNAIKFTHEGSVTLRLQAEEERNASRQIRIEVEDTGIGIPPDQAQQLFQRFSQVDESNTRAYGGTGLGLAISRELVELMDGRIGLSPREGGGSTFWLELALEASDHPANESSETTGLQSQLLPEADYSATHVLVVEDDPVNQVVVRAMLENLSCVVSLAQDGQEAVDLIESQTYGLVLMDLHMPILDGLHATMEIRRLEQRSDRAAMPILALTANVMPGTEQDCQDAGMDGYLSKPIQQAELHYALAQWTNAQLPETAGITAVVDVTGDCLDAEQLSYQRETLGHVFPTLVETFIEQTPILLDELDEAISEEDAERCWGLAHRLKSSSAQVGAMNLSQAGKAMEQRGRGGDSQLANELLAVRKEFRRVEKALLDLS